MDSIQILQVKVESGLFLILPVQYNQQDITSSLKLKIIQNQDTTLDEEIRPEQFSVPLFPNWATIIARSPIT